MKGRRGPARGTYVQRDYAEVARIACAAHANGERMSLAIAARYGTHPRNASQIISGARRAGHSIPLDLHRAYGADNRHGITDADRRAARLQRAEAADVPLTGAALTCDCGHTVYLAEHMPGDRMLRHTISEHGRRPHAHERTPRQARSEAA